MIYRNQVLFYSNEAGGRTMRILIARARSIETTCAPRATAKVHHQEAINAD